MQYRLMKFEQNAYSIDQKNEINLIDFYDEFSSENSKDFIFENFTYGDIHWNKKGTNIIFNALLKKINL